MRLFLAIAPDAAVVTALEQTQAALRRSLDDGGAAVRWTAAADAHVTLHFLGEIPLAEVEALCRALGDLLPVPPFATTLGRAGAFPPRGRPSTIWVGVEAGRDGMQAVHGHLAQRLRAAGIGVETRTFSPHVTIGRTRSRDGRPLPQLRSVLAALEVPAVVWRVDRVTLFSSDLSGARPRYVPLHEISLSST